MGASDCKGLGELALLPRLAVSFPLPMELSLPTAGAHSPE